MKEQKRTMGKVEEKAKKKSGTKATVKGKDKTKVKVKAKVPAKPKVNEKVLDEEGVKGKRAEKPVTMNQIEKESRVIRVSTDEPFDGAHIYFEIPGKIRGKQRARIFQDANTGKMRGRTPDETVNYENWVKMCFLKKYRQVVPTSEALEVHIHAYFVRPKTNKKTEPVTVKIDLDNICKSVLDALNGLAYVDDRQVVGLHALKMWGDVERVVMYIKVM